MRPEVRADHKERKVARIGVNMVTDASIHLSLLPSLPGVEFVGEMGVLLSEPVHSGKLKALAQ